MDSSKVIRIEHRHPAGARHTLIECSLGNQCNYACSYCPTHLHDGSIGWHAYDDLIRFLANENER